MRKKIVLACFAMAFSASSFGQIVGTGSIITEAYYGFPNLFGAVLQAAIDQNANGEDITINSLGPTGVRGEYMLTDKVGIGVDVGIDQVKLTYRAQGFDNDGNFQMYDYVASTKKIGALMSVNYHFATTQYVDFFGLVGVGYKKRTFDFTSNDPNFIATSTPGLIPVAFRLGIGVRYFITPMIGAHLNLGFGHAALINTGVSFAF